MTALPLAPLPANVADAVFMAFGSAALAWALTRKTTRNPQLLVFASVAFLTAIGNVQWSPLMTAAGLLPALGFLLACKPTIGLALLAAYPSWRSIVGGGVFAAITVADLALVAGSWLGSWHRAHFMAPVTSWGGPLVLLGLRSGGGRRPGCWWDLPAFHMTAVLYETIPLFLVAQTWAEGAILALLTPLVWYFQEYVGGPYSTFEAWSLARAQWQLLFIYFPCVVMVLRRPNAGASLDLTAPRSWWPQMFRAPSTAGAGTLNRVPRVKPCSVERDEDPM